MVWLTTIFSQKTFNRRALAKTSSCKRYLYRFFSEAYYSHAYIYRSLMITFIDLHEVSVRKPFVNLPYTIPLTYTLYSNNIRSQGIEAHFGVTFCFYSKSDKNQSGKINWNFIHESTNVH